MPVDLDRGLGERPTPVGVDQLEQPDAGDYGGRHVVAAGDGLLECLLGAHQCVLVGSAAPQAGQQGGGHGVNGVGCQVGEHRPRVGGEGGVDDAGLRKLIQHRADLAGQFGAQGGHPCGGGPRLRFGGTGLMVESLYGVGGGLDRGLGLLEGEFGFGDLPLYLGRGLADGIGQYRQPGRLGLPLPPFAGGGALGPGPPLRDGVDGHDRCGVPLHRLVDGARAEGHGGASRHGTFRPAVQVSQRFFVDRQAELQTRLPMLAVPGRPGAGQLVGLPA